MRNKNASNAPLSNWIRSLSQSPENLLNSKLFDGGPCYPDFVETAKGMDCLGGLDKNSPNYSSVMQSVSCMNSKIENNNKLQEAIPPKERLNELKKLPSAIEDGSFNEKDIQDLLALNNEKSIVATNCSLGNFPKNSDDLQLTILNGSGKGLKDPDYVKSKEVQDSLSKFINCLTVKRPKNKVEGKNVYKSLLASEMAFKAQYEQPLNMARQSLLAGELSPNQKNSLDNSFKSLIVSLKNDKIFTNQINAYADKLRNGIKSAMEQKGEDPLDVAYPLFNACLQLNPLRFKNDQLNDGKTTYDSSTITAAPANTGKKHIFKKDVPNNDYSACNLLSCVLPQPNWKDGDKDEVSKYKEMACNSTKAAPMYEDNLNIRLARLKNNLKLQSANPDADTYLDKICENSSGGEGLLQDNQDSVNTSK